MKSYMAASRFSVSRFLARASGFSVLTVTLACSTSLAPRVVTLPDPKVHPAETVGAIFDYRVAGASVLHLFESAFGFASFPVTFYFCPGERGFEATLLETGYDAALARQTAQNMSAVGGHRRVFLNESALDRLEWPGRVASLAHELGHSLEYEWGGGVRGASDQWLREGFAEWLANQVMDRLGGDRFSDVRGRYRRELRATRTSNAPRLDEMATFRQWVMLGGRRDIAPYAQSLLAVDFLIERHGLPAVVDYFERFARVQDREGNFRAAFGEDLPSFERAVRAHLFGKGK
jgi:hypothetical protein